MLSWTVKRFDINTQTIIDYDVLKYREDFIRRLRKISANKLEFSERLKSQLGWSYRRKAEYELIVSVAGARVMISPWCGAKDPNKSSIFIVGDDPFGWVSFAEYHIERQLWVSEAKVDIYDQLMWRWDDLVDYCWKADLSSE